MMATMLKWLAAALAGAALAACATMPPTPAPAFYVMRHLNTPAGSRDGRIIATGCEAHNCGPHHWTILIDTEAPAPRSAAQNSTLERATWYVAGRPAEERPGDCPNSSG
jgi:hypothetical protein